MSLRSSLASHLAQEPLAAVAAALAAKGTTGPVRLAIVAEGICRSFRQAWQGA